MEYAFHQQHPLCLVVLVFVLRVVSCQSIVGGAITTNTELQYNIEEADVRTVPHILDAAKNGSICVIVLSNDSDVLVLNLPFKNIKTMV